MLCRRHNDLAKMCAVFSEQAYRCDIKDGTFIEDKQTDCQAFVTRMSNDVIVTGQGTTTLKDWAVDLQVWRTHVSYLNNTKVHAGFVKAYDAIREAVHVEIKKHIENGCTRIICTGHSLFGAIATIAALDCAFIYDLPVCCVTFGSPRVGSKGFAKCFNNNVDVSIRFVRNKDPITFTPLPLRFRHVRGSTALKDTTTCFGCGVDDHSMLGYRKCVHGYEGHMRAKELHTGQTRV